MIELNNPQHAEVIAKVAGIVRNPMTDACISRSEDGKLLGGVIYKDYTGFSLSMHVAGFAPYWINRDMLWVCFDYPFNQLRCGKLFGPTSADNIQALEFNQKIGFKLDTIIRDVFPTGDMHLLSMYREECRWLKLKPRTIKAGDSDDGRQE